jgi:hypothetical protein
MKRIKKMIGIALVLLVVAALSGCALGQAASPTPVPVDVNVVMTSAAATAFVELTAVANQATSTPLPTLEPTATLVAPTETQAQPAATLDPAAAAPTATSAPAQLLPTETPAAAGLPATPTLAVMAGTQIPTLTPLAPAAPAGGNTGPTCYNSKFVADVTIPDGTVMQPYQKFYKVWRIQNTGTCPWDQGYGFIQYTGPNMGTTSTYFSNHDQPVGPGGIVDIGVELRAPTEPNEYVAHWTMINDTGKTFGGDFTVVIKVVK